MDPKCEWEDTILGNYLLTVGARSLLRKMRQNITELGIVRNKLDNITYSMDASDILHPPIRGEEIGIILLILALWMAAIALFVHRWGKIRMLEPYQAPYKEIPRTSMVSSQRLSVINAVGKFETAMSRVEQQRCRAHSVLMDTSATASWYSAIESRKRAYSAEDVSKRSQNSEESILFRMVPEVIEEDEELDVKVV